MKPRTDPPTDPIAASRRALQEVLAGLRQEVERPPDPFADLPARERAIILAAAQARVLSHPRPWTTPSAVEPFWNGPGPAPTRWQLEGVARRAYRMIPHLTGLDDDLAPWPPGFFHGLRLAGALVVHGGRLRLQAGQPWLEEDLGRLPIPGRLAVPDRQGRRWIVGCQAWRVPVRDPLGADVVAGLLAGARRVERADGTWLALAPTESVTGLLDYWGFSRTEEGDQVLVSPLFAVLLAGRMPPACVASMVAIRRVGDCPLLALCCWELLWEAGPPPHYMLPSHAQALPFICSNSTRKRRGWTRDRLHWQAVARRLASPAPGLCRLLKDWRARNAAQPG